MTSVAPEARDREDMARLVAGHDAALNSLMERHAEALFHYLQRLLANETEATDLAQETFVRIYQNRERFNSAQKFSTWMYAIATNLVRDRFRWRKRHPQVSLDAEMSDGAALLDTLAETSGAPDDRLTAEERARKVRQAIAALPEEWRTVVILSEYEGLSHTEIGAVLGCSAKAVENRLYRARNQLRKQLVSKSAVLE
jgi:RNA polymerase sigma-70 factor (ECF subfamily)